MAPARPSEHRSQSSSSSSSSSSHEPEEYDDVIDIDREPPSDAEEVPRRRGYRPQQQQQQQQQQQPHQESTHGTPSRPRSPAYVAPIPRIGSIPPVSPGIGIGIPQISPPADRPELPALVGEHLVGKLVDEDGDVIDEETGQLLAHAAGDLPSMVGRRVSNARGDILADDGTTLLGYVADVEWGRVRSNAGAGGPGQATLSPQQQQQQQQQQEGVKPAQAQAQSPLGGPRSLFDLMGRARSSLMVDHNGNILDANGNVVGRFHDNNNPLHRKEKEEREARERAQAQHRGEKKPGEDGKEEDRQQPTPTEGHGEQEGEQEPTQPGGAATVEGEGEGARPPRRTEEERRKNAEAWRKENPNESPSDIFLDVKSTREGIQLTIRIPTVFNGQQTTPHISFSS